MPPLRALVALPILTLLSACSLAQVPREVQVELVGETSVWQDRHTVYETTEDAKFQVERYGTDFHVRIHGLPEDTYRVRLGLAEMKFLRRGQRRFSLTANGKLVLEGFDILDEVANYEALVKVFRVRLEEPVLDLHFTAEEDNAKFCFIRVHNREFVAEVTPRLPVARPAGGEQPDAPYMDGMFETSIGRFGSRVSFNPRPRSREWWQGALGHADYSVAHFEKNHAAWADQPYDMIFGTEYRPAEDGPPASYALPFTESVASFPLVSQRIRPTTLTYTCRAPDLPYEVEFRYAAPFYPQDLKLSTAPYIRLDATVRDRSGRGCEGRVVVAQGGHEGETVAPLEAEGYVGWVHSMPQFAKATEQVWAAEEAEGLSRLEGDDGLIATSDGGQEASQSMDGDGRAIVPVVTWQPLRGLAWEFALEPGGEATKSLVYVGWCAEPVLYTKDRNLPFKYLEYFDSSTEVVRYAFEERGTADRRSALFEQTVLGVEGLPAAYGDLFSLAFQSWVMNTWSMADDVGDWYSCWEGCCKFHSTVDVEYNQWPFYLLYWPELARLTLDAWARHERGGVMPHDMGMGFEIGEMQYPHHMEVEENTNYVLLLFAYWRSTGDDATVEKHLELAGRLMDFVADCDTDDDGYPEKGTSNTIDQGSRVIQHAPKQTYLAVKALSAWSALSVMAEGAGNAEMAKTNAARAALVARSMAAEAWLGDHYAVALKPKAEARPERDRWDNDGTFDDYGMTDPGMGPRGGGYGGYSPPQPVVGWDGFSIYTSNGLLLPLAYGLPVDMDIDQLRQDLMASTRATLKRLGSPHTDREGNTWISQNLWRDMVAAYMGLDMLDNTDRYWSFELDQNRRKRGCFTDVYNYGGGSTSLDYYPRGITLAGLVPAAAGLRLDRKAASLSFAPVRLPLHIPLTALADWEAETVPWARLTAGPEGVAVDLHPGEAAEGWAVTTRPAGAPFAGLGEPETP